MGWQERFRVLGDELTSGKITVGEYRKLSEGILAEAERTEASKKVHIPASAAWEAPSGEMTQIVGAQDETTVVREQIGDRRDPGDGSQAGL